MIKPRTSPLARCGAGALACAALALAIGGAPLAAASGRSAIAKAELVHNIIRFVELPGQRLRLRLCVLRSDEMAQPLADLAGEPLGTSRLEVALKGTMANLADCNVIYLGAAAAGSVSVQPGQVLIGEGPRFVDEGGTVALLVADGPNRFAVNTRNASKGGVRFSSHLLRLASRVVN
jgi:YfiR/HmsC-like